jgi:VCBS repeat-containing protein
VGTVVIGAYGSITINADGTYSYTVDNTDTAVQALRMTANTLTDVFTYTMTDTAGSVATAQLSITLRGANDAPDAFNDTATAVEAGGVSNRILGIDPDGNVLDNDTDLDGGDTKTIIGVSFGNLTDTAGDVGNAVLGNYGTIVINADGSYQYTVDNANTTVQALRDSSDTLTEVFTYTMRDTVGLTSTAQITVTILGVNDAPINSGRNYSTSYLDTLTVNTDGALTGATDSELDAITARLLTVPLSGTLVFNVDGTFTYKPVLEFQGQVTFVYQAFDGEIYSDPITVTIEVYLPKNLPGSEGSSGSTQPSSSTDSSLAAVVYGVAPNVGTVAEEAPTANEQAVASQAAEAPAATEATAMMAAEEQQAEREAKEMESREFASRLRDVEYNRFTSSHIIGVDLDGAGNRSRIDRNTNVSSPYAKEQEREVRTNADQIESVVFNTVIGTGFLLWVVQGAQLAATLISAAPAWIQIDPLAVMNMNEDPKLKKEELSAGEKLFE